MLQATVAARLCCSGGSSRSYRKRDWLKRKLYEKELERLHVRLVQVQGWVQRTGAKICGSRRASPDSKNRNR
jgi:hypothetical protein